MASFFNVGRSLFPSPILFKKVLHSSEMVLIVAWVRDSRKPLAPSQVASFKSFPGLSFPGINFPGLSFPGRSSPELLTIYTNFPSYPVLVSLFQAFGQWSAARWKRAIEK